MELDVGRARMAIAERVAKPLGLGIEECAEGIIRVVNASMIKGIRVVSVAKGYDARDFCLVAFGGAGPVHSAELAEEMDIPRVLVPVAPGVTSALGLLMADLRHDFVRTVLLIGDGLTHEELGARFTEMEGEALERMRQEGVEAGDVTLVRLSDIRYAGQGYELEVPVPSGTLDEAEMQALSDRFHEAHRQMYGYATRDRPIEAVNLRVTALTTLPRPSLIPAELNGRQDPDAAREPDRDVYFRGRSVPTPIYHRPRLRPGDVVNGPAIIEQEDSTTVVWEGQTSTVDAYSNLLLERA